MSFSDQILCNKRFNDNISTKHGFHFGRPGWPTELKHGCSFICDDEHSCHSKTTTDESVKKSSQCHVKCLMCDNCVNLLKF